MSQPEATFKERITNAWHWACRDAFYLIRVPYLQLSLSEHQFNIWWADFVTIQSVEWGLRGKWTNQVADKEKKAVSVNEIFWDVLQFDKLFCIWLSCSVSAGQILPEAWQTVTANMCLSYLAFRKATAMIHNWYCACGSFVITGVKKCQWFTCNHYKLYSKSFLAWVSMARLYFRWRCSSALVYVGYSIGENSV